MPFKYEIILSFLLMSISLSALGQVREVPFEDALIENSEIMTVKMGNLTNNKTYNIRFGTYKLTKSSIKKDYDEDSKFMGIPMENKLSKTFYTTLLNQNGDTVWIDAAQNIEFKEKYATRINDFITIGEDVLISDKNISSVLINTSEKKDDYWLLIMNKTEGAREISLKNFSISSRSERIDPVVRETEEYGSIMVDSSKGLELFFNGESIGGMQYKTGGGFGYKQFIRISNKADKHMQLIAAAIFTSILQLTEGGIAYYFTE